MASNQDILSLLHEDHEKVSHLLEQLSATEQNDSKRPKLFAELKDDLLRHSEAEQSAFYDHLIESKEAEDTVREGIEEHKVVKRLLSELDRMSFDSEQWGAKLTVLKENVEHHVEEEESEMFDQARDVFDEEKLRRFGTEFQQRKQQKKAA